jgi:hypothetical protein
MTETSRGWSGMEKLKIEVDVDTSALKEATEALDALAAAADRAKAALDGLFGEPMTTVTVTTDGSEYLDNIRKGARRSDHRFKL